MNIYTSAIIRSGNRFLLTRHVHIGKPVWLMPGGKPEQDERAKDCLIRECREELGIEITKCDFHAAYINEVGDKEWVGLFFKVQEYSGTPVILEPHKHDNLGWFLFDEMKALSVGQPEMGLACYIDASERANMIKVP